jgi:hypothetical protein
VEAVRRLLGGGAWQKRGECAVVLKQDFSSSIQLWLHGCKAQYRHWGSKRSTAKTNTDVTWLLACAQQLAPPDAC